jgi:hypothetical protein
MSHIWPIQHFQWRDFIYRIPKQPLDPQLQGRATWEPPLLGYEMASSDHHVEKMAGLLQFLAVEAAIGL